ncbi:MAG: DUF5060 domain-containing protein [Armatimonadota bacterium]|nr:DUF5060 domain-containing protein [Armatimonadota bacterium]
MTVRLFCRIAALVIAIIGLGASGTRAARAAALQVTVTPAPGQATPQAYQRAEFAVTVTGGAAPYANPFDPNEIAVDAALVGPKGVTQRVPGFWSAPYQRGAPDAKTGRIEMTPTPGGIPGWRVRVAPPSAGVWRLTVTAKDTHGTGVSKPLTVRVGPSKNPGFVRRATGAGRKRYFQFDNGAPYFLVGENVCWSSGSKGLADYDVWFPALSQSGGNYARLWMAFSPLESKSTGLGRYNLQNAAYFDAVLDEAQKDNLRCMVALDTYGNLATGGFFGEGHWPDNPYNDANGGPVPAADPKAYFTNPTARKLYKQRLRYVVARYSADTSVGFWEFWNEQAAPGAWFAEMGAYLKQTDPNKHLVTNSFSTVGTADVWNVPQIDLTQTHRYGSEGSIRDIATGLPADTRDHDVYAKPHLLGEFGISWQNGDEHYDPTGKGTNMHNGLWGGALSGDAGGGAIWWWDSYVQPKNLYHEFTGLANFARAIDWPNRAFEPLALPAPTVPSVGPETFSDLTLTPSVGWGAKSAGPVTVGRDGQTHGPGTILSVLFGPSKGDQRSPMTFNVDLPRPSVLTLRIGTVSNTANLRVSVDGQTAKDFPFDAAPGKNQDFESTKQFPEYDNIYQAVFNKDRTVPLPAGKHEITLENTTGDWLQINSYKFADALSSRFRSLHTYALQDASGETLIWLEDPESNWQNDRDGIAPKAQTGVSLTVPLPNAGSYFVQWWDTRRGNVISVRTVTAKTKTVTLPVPTFTRDIALRLAPQLSP